MATSGENVPGHDSFRCDVMLYSSCKITKVYLFWTTLKELTALQLIVSMVPLLGWDWWPPC